MVDMSGFRILPIGKPRLNTETTGFPLFVDGDKADLKIGIVLVFGNDTFYTFLTCLLGCLALSHKLYDQKATHGAYYFLPYTCGRRTTNFIVNE